ncbi:MAG: SOS response-associated peptidase [Bacteroidota bacterium]|nr:SOS response-associated peptidase [Bacteroidota bacterium]
MCYHNTLSKIALEVEQRYKAKFVTPELFQPVYHQSAFLFGSWPVITSEFKDIIQLFRWGLIPQWTKDIENAEKVKAFNLNARSETAFEKPSFAASIKYSRCLIPSTGFFEWKHEGKEKNPYYIYLKDQTIFSMAGIWASWVHKEKGHLYHTFSILTTGANELVGEIHNTKKRMPVILRPDKEKEWLSYNADKGFIQEMLLPYPSEKMAAHPISKLITSKTQNNNVPEVLFPL